MTKYFWWIVLALCFMFVILAYPLMAKAECLSSPKEVRAVHGIAAHAYWGYHVSGHDGKKCWSNVSIATAAPPSRKTAVAYPKRREVMHATLVGKNTQTAPYTVTPTSLPRLSGGGDSPPDRIIDLLDEMGWIDYMITYNKLVDYGHQLWDKRRGHQR